MIDASADYFDLFIDAYFGNTCPSMRAEYVEVNDDPDFPPYDSPVLVCTALDDILFGNNDTAIDSIPF